MSYRFLKILTILLPTILIGGFEFLRHSGILLYNLSMKTGNYVITILTFLISCAFSAWMFKIIEEKNKRISLEREMRAIYEERERLAKELHDNIAQTLFLLKVNLKKGKLNEAQSLVNTIDSNLRQAIYNLRINPSEQDSFSKRIESWLDDWSTVSGIDVKVSIEIPEDYFTPSEIVPIFSIIQEAFMNIRKHSEADCASLSLCADTSKWELMIEDNGKGFVIDEIPSTKFGLKMLTERARKLNALINISSIQENGTRITIKGVR